MPASPAFFANANRFNINQFQYFESGGKGQHAWDTLLKHTAPNALYDSKSRFDPPKCDEDTRVEINQEIMDWIHDPASPTTILCLTGAAGSGKSAIQQTIAERCAAENILAASFFFSALDATRNTADYVVATIACQLALASHPLKVLICEAVERDPLVFERSFQTQMNALIVEPLSQLRSCQGVPQAILIDGLDECKEESHQAELLLAIQHCLLAPSLPFLFKIFIASRPEHAIFTSLQPAGHLHSLAYHIRLNQAYDADADIERYLWRRFHAIAGQTSDPRAKVIGWPGERTVHALVTNASGQFIYAATAIKYISERRSSPVDRLHAVISWAPGTIVPGRPFAALDTLYCNILSKARDNHRAAEGESGEDLIVVLKAYDTIPDYAYGMSTWGWRSVFLKLTHGKLQALVCDLRSLVDVQTIGADSDDNEPEERLDIYHKSFFDFLDDADRAGELYVPDTAVVSCILSLCFSHLTDAFLSKKKEQEMSKYSSLGDCFRELSAMLHNALLFGIPLIKADLTSTEGILPTINRFTRLGIWDKLKNRPILDEEMLKNDILMVESLLRVLGADGLAKEIAAETKSWFGDAMVSTTTHSLSTDPQQHPTNLAQAIMSLKTYHTLL
ncbi:hypothetical protein NMY22_g17553 [Coprinellus aureogranulatus]|nr:hypothetical protein NMY22_g17553 [Coprinellus aureogranulatus]